MNEEDAPKLQVDTDWKAEAQAEKERLAAQARELADKSPEGGGPEGPGGLPDASFKTIVGMLASQALMGLGTMADPQGRGVMVDLDGARLSIDLLGVIEEKTRGNLDEEEALDLTQVLGELRTRFVQISQAVAQQMTNPPAEGIGGVEGAAIPPAGPAGGVTLD